MKQSLILAGAGIAGAGVLAWLLNQPSPPSASIQNQDGNPVVFPGQPNISQTATNPAAQFAPYIFPSVGSSGVPSPVPSTTGGPTYLTYNFGDDGGLNLPLASPIDGPPITTTLGNLLKTLRGQQTPSPGNGGGCDCQSSCKQSCTQCTNGGSRSLAVSPSGFVQNLINSIPHYSESVVVNAASSGLINKSGSMVHSVSSNPFNGLQNVIRGVQE